MKKLTTVIYAVIFLAFFGMGKAVFARGESKGTIHVDIPVKLDKANVVFDIARPVLVGGVPLAMHDMLALAKHFKEEGVKGNIVGIFYGSATYMVLNDKAYNASRKTSTGNPYKQAMAKLLKENVHLEVCSVALKEHHWTNRDLLAGVKVNTDAIMRVIQLVQEGYVHMQP